MRLDAIPRDEMGPIRDLPAGQRVRAAALVKRGDVYDLAAVRFPGMPLFPGHPPLSVLGYRTPAGIRNVGDQPWGPGNEVGLGYMSEVISGTAHTGAHIDALAHITIGEQDRWGRGYGTEAVELMLGHAFERLGLHRVGLSVFAFNDRAIRSYEKAGFHEEGRLREAVWRDGRWWDEVQMGVLEREWRERVGAGEVGATATARS